MISFYQQGSDYACKMGIAFPFPLQTKVPLILQNRHLIYYSFKTAVKTIYVLGRPKTTLKQHFKVFFFVFE